MPLSTRATLQLNGTQTGALALGTASATIAKAFDLTTTDGVGAGQADKLYQGAFSIAASGTQDLDLAGVLLDAFAGVISMARVKGIIVSASPTNVNDVLVGGAAATVFSSWVGSATDKVRLRPGALLALLAGRTDATGYVTAAGTSDLLRLANSGAGSVVTGDVVILGCSA